MVLKHLDQLIEIAKKGPKKKLVIAYAQDENSILAAQEAYKMGLTSAILVGDKNEIKRICKEHNIGVLNSQIIHEPNEMAAGRKAVALINEGKGDILMKGLITSDNYIRCIIDKKNGLTEHDSILAHVTIFEVPTYHKLLIISDAAFIPLPSIQQKIAITKYLVNTAHNIGIEKPKVAIISFTEKSDPEIDSSVDAAVISKMGDRGQIKNAYIDGPLALDVAIDPESVEIKGLRSSVAGDADCLVFPQLESANIFYKTLTKLIRAEAASFIAGTRVPIMLSSRGDSIKTKLYSISVGCIMANSKEEE